ncbi:phosphatase PAP2 family protein [Rhodovibrionaceae bacterium A322]
MIFRTSVFSPVAEFWCGLSLLGRYTIALLAIFISILVIDLPLSLFFRWAEGPVVDFGRAITDLAKSKGWLIGSGLLVLFFTYRAVFSGHRPGGRLYRWIAAAAGFWFLAIAGSGILTNLLKIFFGRARPKIFQQEGFFGFDPFAFDAAWHSFPSGHGNTAFVLAILFSLFLPRWRAWAWGLFTFLALQRVVVNAHYLSDVIAGAVVACVTSYWLAQAFAARGWVFVRSASGKLTLAAPGRLLRRKLGLA